MRNRREQPDAVPVQAFEQVWIAVCAIPCGRLASYGDVARLAGLPGKARYVGYALGRLGRGAQVPWHRVVNARGRLSFPPQTSPFEAQREALAQEGIEVDAEGRIHDFHRLRWC